MRLAVIAIALAGAQLTVACDLRLVSGAAMCDKLDATLQASQDLTDCSQTRCGNFCFIDLASGCGKLGRADCAIDFPSENHHWIAFKPCLTADTIDQDVGSAVVITEDVDSGDKAPETVPEGSEEMTTPEPEAEILAEPVGRNSGSGSGSGSSISVDFMGKSKKGNKGKKHGGGKGKSTSGGKKEAKKGRIATVLADPAQSAAVGALAIGTVATVAVAAVAINRRSKRVGYDRLPENKEPAESQVIDC